MLIRGSWLLCGDQVVRPVILGEAQGGDSSWVQIPFLVDTGADHTVFSANVLDELRLPPLPFLPRFIGVGGMSSTVAVETRIRFQRADEGDAIVNGRFGAFTDLTALDMSVLGRDIINYFALIVDRPQDVVCLVSQRHSYSIVER